MRSSCHSAVSNDEKSNDAMRNERPMNKKGATSDWLHVCVTGSTFFSRRDVNLAVNNPTDRGILVISNVAA